MHSVILNMLDSYNCRSVDDYRNAMKEIVQEIALLGLYRAGFYNKAAFYGGTALRIFYGLERFSEDLDFTLLKPDSRFDLSLYTKTVQEELGAYGLKMTVTEKVKKNDSPVKSAFIKGGTQIHLLQIEAVKPYIAGVDPKEQLKIKLEVDINPPAKADYEIKYQLLPVPYSVRLYSASSLFAGKVHALLCRSWKERIKGRDFYDYIWFLSKKIPLNIVHLSKRMAQSGHILDKELLSEGVLKRKLLERFNTVDFDLAKKDILLFIKNPEELKLWGKEFFISITEDKLRVENQD